MEQTTLEVLAPTVEEAVAKGLAELNLTQDEVEVEVLDQGTRGLFGLGSRQARIRLLVKTGTAANAASEPVKAVEVEAEAPAAAVPAAAEAATAAKKSPLQDDEFILGVAQATVKEILEKMGVRAEVKASFPESAQGDERNIWVEVQGKDLSFLIGRRSETINSLQYIASLMVGKELGRWVSLQIDVEGYRQRRERALRQLARRMAEQAVSSGRRQVLEPMPANERRIIHLELRDNPNVVTESTGEEPARKVTIKPTK
ncbi:MAG TPA: RNA-binding cell elongation regulator Jag/EloR [Anaerolineaceae bacterium]|nr:RNA-binding cell elongation regulator Jag/EloR [Anaerolineaceae bacterium]HPN50627.1 RNA-binding cell elongation regulator Jag/EloR [Anaerolineaceae bacterium]